MRLGNYKGNDVELCRTTNGRVSEKAIRLLIEACIPFTKNIKYHGEIKPNNKDEYEILSNYDIPCVPILDEEYVLPDTLEELRAFVDSEGSKLDGEIKEGIVFRSLDGERSFKCVSPEFLIKYHG